MRSMKIKISISIILAAIILGVFPMTALAAQPGAVVIGNSYTLESGQTLNDVLFVLGGNINLMSGSIVNGNVVLIGGSAEAAGTIHGNLTVLGGSLNLASTFILDGNLTTAGTTTNRAPGAQINGQINTNTNNPTVIIPGQVQVPNFNFNMNPFFNVLGFFLRLFLWTLAAMVLAMFIPNHLGRTAQTAVTQPLISGGLGLLTVVVVVVLAILLAITICLIPVSVIAIFLLIIAWCYGLISLGFEVGRRISSTSKEKWHPALSAGLGTLLLIAVLNGVDALVPCVGWIPKVLVGLVGLGAVILTQFGTKEYNPTPRLPLVAPTDTLPPTT